VDYFSEIQCCGDYCCEVKCCGVHLAGLMFWCTFYGTIVLESIAARLIVAESIVSLFVVRGQLLR